MERRKKPLYSALLICLLAVWPLEALAQGSPVKMEWLSWSIFRFTAPSGTVLLTNPFVTNPDSPVKVADFLKVDVILVADGHGDEVGSSDEIALKTGAKIVTPGEMRRNYFEPRKVPDQQILQSNPGDLNKIDNVTIRNARSRPHGAPATDWHSKSQDGHSASPSIAARRRGHHAGRPRGSAKNGRSCRNGIEPGTQQNLRAAPLGSSLAFGTPVPQLARVCYRPKPTWTVPTAVHDIAVFSMYKAPSLSEIENILWRPLSNATMTPPALII